MKKNAIIMLKTLGATVQMFGSGFVRYCSKNHNFRISSKLGQDSGELYTQN